VKEKQNEEIERGSSITSFITSALVVTDKGVFPDTGNFLVFYNMILLESLSNLKAFRFATFRAFDGVYDPNPSSTNGKCPPMRGMSIDDILFFSSFPLFLFLPFSFSRCLGCCCFFFCCFLLLKLNFLFFSLLVLLCFNSFC
jgi:hypothetical protein